MHSTPTFEFLPASEVPHHYSLALEQATSGRERLPWTSAAGAIGYIRDSEEDLLVAREALRTAESRAITVQQANIMQQVEILTGTREDRVAARARLSESQVEVIFAHHRLERVVGLRALAEQEKVVFCGKLGRVAMRNVSLSLPA